MNIDLCFVPLTHEPEQKLPAVSGSSGRLVIERPTEGPSENDWPGRVFEHQELDYSEAMLQFVKRSQEKEASSKVAETVTMTEKRALKEQKRQLYRKEAQLRDERRLVRLQRTQEDKVWKHFKAKRRQQKNTKRPPVERRTEEEQWKELRQQRRETQERRKTQDTRWRQQRLDVKELWGQLPRITDWVAILVTTDNCTRQCLGLPLFVVGSKVTAEMIIESLTVLLPLELHFLITDRGTHFKAKIFEQFARQQEFIHVLIARHRPQSNGIAERFVRTLKEWLKDKSWQNDQELAALLTQFLKEYNDRPHQGLLIPGLSPNEFANRIWVM